MFIFDKELEILETMRPTDEQVFSYLSKRMDFETGVIGRSRKISHGGIAFDLTEHDSERRIKATLQTLTARQVRSSVSRLISNGLLRSLSKKGKHKNLILERVFWVNLLSMANSVQKPEGNQLANQTATEIYFLYNLINKLDNKNKTSAREKSKAEGKTSFTTYKQQDNLKFKMTNDWKPTEDLLREKITENGFKFEDVKPIWITEQVMYWSRGDYANTQEDWTLRLVQTIVFYLENPGSYEKRCNFNNKNGKSSLTANKNKEPDWAIIPVFDDDLDIWVRRHGYEALIRNTNSYAQARSVLRTYIRKKKDDLDNAKNPYVKRATALSGSPNIPKDCPDPPKPIEVNSRNNITQSGPIVKTQTMSRTEFFAELSKQFPAKKTIDQNNSIDSFIPEFDLDLLDLDS